MDDEVSIRQLGSAVIKRMGLDVTAVNDGSAVVNEYAAATAAGRPYDLVILDLTVPGGMGGAEAMERLRKMDDRVRAIVSSGYSSQSRGSWILWSRAETLYGDRIDRCGERGDEKNARRGRLPILAGSIQPGFTTDYTDRTG